MVSIEFGRSPLLGKLYRRTSGSAGPFQFRTKGFQGEKKKKKRKKKEGGAWFRFLIVNSKFNSSQKRVQSRGRVDSFGKIGTYLIASVFEREGEGKKRKGKKKKKNRAKSKSLRGSWKGYIYIYIRGERKFWSFERMINPVDRRNWRKLECRREKRKIRILNEERAGGIVLQGKKKKKKISALLTKASSLFSLYQNMSAKHVRSILV